jgi:hypothetical protein
MEEIAVDEGTLPGKTKAEVPVMMRRFTESLLRLILMEQEHTLSCTSNRFEAIP